MKKLIIANWKMNLAYRDSLQLAKQYALSHKLKQAKREIVVCPDYLTLPVISGIIKGSGLSLGAQNCSAVLSGAQTGEVSAKNLQAIGVKYVIIGHSERRQGLGEDSALVAAKVKAALAANLRPILCIGETAQIKDKGQTKRFLSQELKLSLAGLDKAASKRLVIAYEPVWAISTAKKASPLVPEEAEAIHKYLSDLSTKLLGQAVPVLYGGSVKPDNAKEYLAKTHISGLLVGGASLRIADFEAVCEGSVAA
jgi:triosephosphate isomerase